MSGKKNLFIGLGLCIVLAIVTILFIVVDVAYAAPDLVPLSADLPEGTEITCTATSINLREQPVVENDNIIAVIHKDDVLIFQGWTDEPDWVYVKFDDVLGYCTSKYLVYDPNKLAMPSPTPSEIPSSTPAPTPSPSPSPSPTLDITPTTTSDITPQITGKEAPTPIPAFYVTQWKDKSISEKLSAIPLWLFGVVFLGLIIIIVYRLLKRRNK